MLVAVLGVGLVGVVDAQSPPVPPVGTITTVGVVASLSPTCASSEGDTSVTVTATGAPTGDLTCRFVQYDLAVAMEAAEAAEATATTAYDDAVTAGENERALLGYTPNAALATIATALEALTAAQYVTGNATEEAVTAMAMATPVDLTTVTTTTVDGVTTTTATCIVPSGDGAVLTVSLVGDGGAEGTDQYGNHYPLSDSSATKISTNARTRRTGLSGASPGSGPSKGGTIVTFIGQGFASPMTCSYALDSTSTVVDAVILNSTALTCVSPAGAGSIDVTLAFDDRCELDTTFLYFDAPRVLAVRPTGGPRFGAVSMSAYATNLGILSSAPESVTPYCALGGETTMADSTVVTLGVDGFEPVAVLPGSVGSDGASVVCPTFSTEVDEGVHVVRVSLNGQQFGEPSEIAVNAGTSTFQASGPFVQMTRESVRVGEGIGAVSVTVELTGESILPTSVYVNVTDGGSDAIRVLFATILNTDGEEVEQFVVSSSLAEATRKGSYESDVDVMLSSSMPILQWDADVEDMRLNRLRTITITVSDDGSYENALEALTLELINPTNADVDVDNSVTVIVIEDDDDVPTIAVRPYQVAYPPTDEIGAQLYETETVQIPVDVVTGSSALAFSASYVVSNGTAVAGVTYTATSGTLSWAAQDSSTKFIDVSIHWSVVAPEAELTIGVTLTPIENIALDTTDLTNWQRSMAVTEALRVFGVPPGVCPPGTRRTTSEGWIGAPPPPSPPPPSSPPPPPPPPPGSNDDAELYYLAVVSQLDSIRDAVTGEVYVPDPMHASLTPTFSPGERSFNCELENAIETTTVEYRTRSRDATVVGVEAVWAASTVPTDVEAFALGNDSEVLALDTSVSNYVDATSYWGDTDSSRRKLLSLSSSRRGLLSNISRRKLAQVLGDVEELAVTLNVGATVVTWNISAASETDNALTTQYQLSIRRLVAATSVQVAGVVFKATTLAAADSNTGFDTVETLNIVVDSEDDTVDGSTTFDATHYTYQADQVLPYNTYSISAIVDFSVSSEVLIATMAVTSSDGSADPTVVTLNSFSNDANGETGVIPLKTYLPEHDLITIRVLCTDGATTKTYAIKVTRAAQPGLLPPPAVPSPPPTPSPPPVDIFQDTAPVSPADSTECTHCPAGTFSDNRDVLICTPCTAGLASATSRALACSLCPAGYFARNEGSLVCAPCPSGTSASASGSTTCALCAQGTTTVATGASAECNVTDTVVDETHADVFFVKVGFTIRFTGSSLGAFDDTSSDTSITSVVGVDTDPAEVYKVVTKQDTATGFEVPLSRVAVSNVTIPSLGVYGSSRRKAKKLRRSMLQEETVEETTACTTVTQCVVSSDIKVTVQATEVPPEGLVTTYEFQAAAVAEARERALKIIETLLDDPSAFFSSTVTALGGSEVITATVTGEVSISEKVPDPPDEFRDAFYGLPTWLDPYTVVGLACGVIFLWTVLPRVWKYVAEWYGKEKVNAALARSIRAANSNTQSKTAETANPEMRAMTRVALAQLARYKNERAKTHLEKMWDRRALATPGVGEMHAEQFGKLSWG